MNKERRMRIPLVGGSSLLVIFAVFDGVCPAGAFRGSGRRQTVPEDGGLCGGLL